MIPQFDNNLSASLFLWSENRILDKGQAYINSTTRLYYVPDETLGTGFVSYSAPYKQWVYDSGIQGATIINSVSGGATIYNKGDNGMKIDYDNGRVIFDASVGRNLVLTGSYAFKEINFYSSPEDQNEILSEFSQGIYARNPKYNGAATSGAKPHQITTPAIFVTRLNGNNTPFELGGMVDSKRNYSLLILADSTYQVDAVCSIMQDATYKSFPYVTVPEDPINEWGDLKSGYNYNNLKESNGGAGNLVYIESMSTSKISDNYQGPNNIYLGICDIELSFARLTS